MSEFYDLIDQHVGQNDDIFDIRVVVRRLWFYDFLGYPTYLWQGKGKLITSDGKEWLGTIDANNEDHHTTPPLQDGRDGSSAQYQMGLKIQDLPDQSARELYEGLKSEQSLCLGRKLTCYLAIFQENEGLRPTTPYVFFKELIMYTPKFTEGFEPGEAGSIVRKYEVSLIAKDANFGRSNTPRGTYADTIQKQRAKERGVSLDRGCEFLAGLANRTYIIP